MTHDSHFTDKNVGPLGPWALLLTTQVYGVRFSTAYASAVGVQGYDFRYDQNRGDDERDTG